MVLLVLKTEILIYKCVSSERDELGRTDGVREPDLAEHLVRVGAEVKVRAVGARHTPTLPLLRLGLHGLGHSHLVPSGRKNILSKVIFFEN